MNRTCYDCASQWCTLKGTFERACTGYTPTIYTTSDDHTRIIENPDDTSTGFDPDAYKYTSTETVSHGDPYKKSKKETLP